LGLDDRDPWAYLMQGFLLLRTGRQAEAERSHRRALELNPNFALVYAVISWMLAAQGKDEEAIGKAQFALRLSPSDRLVSTYAGRAMTVAHFSAGRYAECIASASNQVEARPEEFPAYVMIAAAQAILGETIAAAEATAALLALRPEFSVAWWTENFVVGLGEYADRLNDGLRRAGVPEA
jgi:tetratricopeptide (TPR) repeat protein